jgi:hypothetical protein
MLFGNIVTDLALCEYLGYQILADKVAWDCQGNPKKPFLPSKKVVSGSLARPSSKKSWAHKNVGASNKLTVDPKPGQKDVVIGPSSLRRAHNFVTTLVAGEESSAPKRKSSVDASPSIPPQKKG